MVVANSENYEVVMSVFIILCHVTTDLFMLVAVS